MKKGQDFTGVSVVFQCHDGKGNFLLAKRGMNSRDEQGVWDCGAGGVEFGDSIEETLHKEILEEYGTPILGFEFLGFRDIHRMHNNAKTHWIALDYKVLVDRDKVKNGEPHKLDAVDWFTLDALPEPMHSQWPIFFGAYESKLRA